MRREVERARKWHASRPAAGWVKVEAVVTSAEDRRAFQELIRREFRSSAFRERFMQAAAISLADDSKGGGGPKTNAQRGGAAGSPAHRKKAVIVLGLCVRGCACVCARADPFPSPVELERRGLVAQQSTAVGAG